MPQHFLGILNMSEDNLDNKLENYAGKRIWFPNEKIFDFMKAKKFLGNIAHYVDGVTSEGLPDGFVRRKSPVAGRFERVELRDACTDAVIQTIISKYSRYVSPESIYEFLNPAKIGRSETPYREKLPVIIKLLDSFYDEFYGGHHCTYYAGNIPDPTSFKIGADSSETEFFWFEYHPLGISWEALYDTKKPDTKFMLKNLYHGTSEEKALFQELRKIHEQENLFKDGPLSFIRPIGWGWHLPILGVTEIIGLFEEGSYPQSFTIQTILSKKGISSKEVEIKQRDKKWLLPEGYDYRDR